MEYTYKFITFIFSCIFFISVSWAFPAPGSHYAYVTGNYPSGKSNIAIITRYKIAESNGNLIKPLSKVIAESSAHILGVALAPDNHNIYYAYGFKVTRCTLNENGTVSDNCTHTSLPRNAKPNFLAISRNYNKLYITDIRNANVYSCNINMDHNDNLSDCHTAVRLAIPEHSTQGIAVSNSDGTVYINATIKFAVNYIFTCGINPATHEMYPCQTYLQEINNDQFLGGMRYIPNDGIAGTGILTTANMGMGYLGTQCVDIGEVLPCTSINAEIGNQFAERTFDVAWDPINHTYQYFTSSDGVFKWIFDTVTAPVRMPETLGIRTYAIDIF